MLSSMPPFVLIFLVSSLFPLSSYQMQEYTYFASDSTTSWTEAKQYCESHNNITTKLAVFHLTTEHRSAARTCSDAIQSSNETAHGCWIGLYSNNTDGGDWRWIDHTITDYGFINNSIADIANYPWRNTLDDTGGSGCMKMMSYSDGRWNANSCSTPMYYAMCQSLITTGPTATPSFATLVPSNNPTFHPTAPSNDPTFAPLASTSAPSNDPTLAPSNIPTFHPTASSNDPTSAPSVSSSNPITIPSTTQPNINSSTSNEQQTLFIVIIIGAVLATCIVCVIARISWVLWKNKKEQEVHRAFALARTLTNKENNIVAKTNQVQLERVISVTNSVNNTQNNAILTDIVGQDGEDIYDNGDDILNGITVGGPHNEEAVSDSDDILSGITAGRSQLRSFKL
eukprot:42729_1